MQHLSWVTGSCAHVYCARLLMIRSSGTSARSHCSPARTQGRGTDRANQGLLWRAAGPHVPSMCPPTTLAILTLERRQWANGSGGRGPDLANLCGLPACARLAPPHATKIIPHIFRIMVQLSGRPSAFQTSCHWRDARGWMKLEAAPPADVVLPWRCVPVFQTDAGARPVGTPDCCCERVSQDLDLVAGSAGGVPVSSIGGRQGGRRWRSSIRG